MVCANCGAALAQVAGSCPACGNPINQITVGHNTSLTSRSTPENIYAGFWRRTFAYLIDYVLLTVIIVVAALAASTLGLTNPAAILGLMYAFLPLIYFLLLEASSLQASLGKKAVGAKVTDLQGQRITGGRALGRYLGKIVSGLTLGIGFAMAGCTAKRQALHDMMSGCLVVHSVATPVSIAHNPGSPRGLGYIAAMIVLTILCGPVSLGIAAAAAISFYQGYAIRPQIMNGLMMAGPLKIQIAEYYADNGRWPEMADLSGPFKVGKYEKSIEVNSGAIVIVYGGPLANSVLEGMRLVMSPAVNEDNHVVWQCGSAKPPPGLKFSVDPAKSISVPPRYLPDYCHS